MSFQSSSLSSSTYSSLAYDYDIEGIGKGMCGQAVLSKLRPRYYNKRSQRGLLKRGKNKNNANPIDLKPINTLFVTEGEYLHGTTSEETNSGNNSREGGEDNNSIKSGPSLKMIAQFDVKSAMDYQVPPPQEEEEEESDEEHPNNTPKSTPSNTPKSSNRRFDFEAHDDSLLLETGYHQYQEHDFHKHNSQDGYYHNDDDDYDDDVSCYSDEDDTDTDNTDFYLRNTPPSPRSSKSSSRGRRRRSAASPIPERVVLLSTVEETTTDDDESRDNNSAHNNNAERPSPIGAVSALSESMHANDRRNLSGSNHDGPLSGSMHARSLSGSNHGGSMHSRSLSGSNHGLSGSTHARSLSGSNHGLSGSTHARSLSGSNHSLSGSTHVRSLSGSNHGLSGGSIVHASSEAQHKRSISPVSASRAIMEDEDTLVTMRAMLLRQQQSLRQLEAKNRAYRERLSASHNRVQEVRKDQLQSKDAIIKLQFERESFEAEAVWLREELKKMKNNGTTREEREADAFFDELEGKAKSEVRWSRTGILHLSKSGDDKSTCVEEPESPASSQLSSQLPHQRTSDLLQAMSSEYELSVVSSSSFERDLKGTRRALKSKLRIITSDDDVDDEVVDASTVTELGDVAPGASFENELKYHRKMLHASPSKLKSDVSATKSASMGETIVSFESPLASSSRSSTHATTPHSRVTPQSRANTSAPNIREAEAAASSSEDTAPESDFERSLRETRQALQSKQRSKPTSKEDLKTKFAERASIVSSQSQMSPSRRDSMISPLGTSLDRSSHSATSRPNPIMVPKVAQSEEEESLVSPLGASLDRSSRIVPQLAQLVQSEGEGPLVSPLGASLDRSSHSARSQPKPRFVPQLAQSEEEDSLVSPLEVSLDRSTTQYSVRSQPKPRAVPKSTQSEGGGSLVSSLVGLKYSTPQSVASQQHQQTRFGGDGSLSSPLGVSLDCSSLQSIEVEADAVEVLLTKVASLEISRSSPEPETENPSQETVQKDASGPSFSNELTTRKDSSLPVVSPFGRSPGIRGRSTSPAVRSPRFFPPSPTSAQQRDDASASSNRSSSLGRLQQGSPSRRKPRYFSQVGNTKREPSSPALSNNANGASSPRKSPRKSPRYFWEIGSLTDGEDSTVASTPQSKHQTSPTKRSARFFSPTEDEGENFEQQTRSPPPRSPRTRRSPSPSPKATRDNSVRSRAEEDRAINRQEHVGATRRRSSKSPRASDRKRGDASRGVPQQEHEKRRVTSSQSVNTSPSRSYLNREPEDQPVDQASDSLRPEAGNLLLSNQRAKSPHPSSLNRGPGSQWVDEIPTSLHPETGTHRGMSIQSESTVPSLSSCLDDFSHQSSMSHGQECGSEQLGLSRPPNAMHQRVLEQRARRSPSPSPRNRDEVSAPGNEWIEKVPKHGRNDDSLSLPPNVMHQRGLEERAHRSPSPSPRNRDELSVPGNQWIDKVPKHGKNNDSKAQRNPSTSESVKTTESASQRRLFVRFDSTVGTASEQPSVSSSTPVAESSSSLGSQQKLKEISPYGFLREEYEAGGFDFPGSETASLWSSSTTQVKNGAANRPKPERERPRVHKSPVQHNVEHQPPVTSSSAVSPRTRYMVAAHKKFITASPNVAPRRTLPQATLQTRSESSSSSSPSEVKNNTRVSSAHPVVVDSIQSFPSLGSSESREEIYRMREAAARIDGTRRNDLAKQFFKAKKQASSPTMSFPEANAEMRWARSQKQMLELMKKEVAEKQVKEQRKVQQRRSFSRGDQPSPSNSTSNESLQRRAEKVRMDLLRANLEAAEQSEGRDDVYERPARGDDALREPSEPRERIYGNTPTASGRSSTPSPSRPTYRKNAISSY